MEERKREFYTYIYIYNRERIVYCCYCSWLYIGDESAVGPINESAALARCSSGCCCCCCAFFSLLDDAGCAHYILLYIVCRVVETFFSTKAVLRTALFFFLRLTGIRRRSILLRLFYIKGVNKRALDADAVPRPVIYIYIYDFSHYYNSLESGIIELKTKVLGNVYCIAPIGVYCRQDLNKQC